MMHIGIIGAGIAGLHLGIALRSQGIDATIYTDHSADELTKGRLLNTVMHHHMTLDRERQLGVDHWDPQQDGWRHRHQYVDGPRPLRYSATLVKPSFAIDYRLYLPTLMKDFEEAGGHLIIRPVHVNEADRLAHAHDLLVVATGRSGMSLLFPTREDLPPVGVRRRICAVLTEGIEPAASGGVTLSVAPDVGELIEIPIMTAAGKATALLFESRPDSAAASRLAEAASEGLPALQKTVLDVLRTSYPETATRVDDLSFEIRGPKDVFVGAIAPALRRGSTYLPSGKLAIALGDAHVLVDPLMGQGANIASFSAQCLADAISDDLDFDEQFRRRLEDKREPLLRAAYEWTNLQLQDPPHVKLIHEAAADDPALANDFIARHAHPEKMWQVVQTQARTATYLRQFGQDPTTTEDNT